MIVPCECGAKLKIDDAKLSGRSAKVRCPRCGNVMIVQPQPAVKPEISPAPPPSSLPPDRTPGPVVLIAHESEAVRIMIRDILLDGGFGVETASDGVETLKKAAETRPQALLLDVGLPGIYGFELCERLKQDEQTKDIKIILLTSIYDMSRYKRPPASLYGADDYIEKHQITDYLPLKIRKLIYPEQYADIEKPAAATAPDVAAMPKAPARESESYEFGPDSLLKEAAEPSSRDAAPAGAQTRQSKAPAGAEPSSWLDTFIKQAHDGSAMAPDSFTLDSSIFQKQESEIPSVNEADPGAVEKAKRLARIIVSDIAIYNPGTVIEGVKNGTFYELLKSDIEEGRDLYEKRVSPSVRSKKDYYQEAFDNFIDAQKKIVR